MATPVCRYNKFGFCRYKECCQKLHVNEVCDDTECDALSCNKRHPRKCKYHKYRKCKFGTDCKFDHDIDDLENNEVMEKVKMIENKLIENEKEMKKHSICEEKFKQVENMKESFICLEKQEF